MSAGTGTSCSCLYKKKKEKTKKKEKKSAQSSDRYQARIHEGMTGHVDMFSDTAPTGKAEPGESPLSYDEGAERDDPCSEKQDKHRSQAATDDDDSLV